MRPSVFRFVAHEPHSHDKILSATVHGMKADWRFSRADTISFNAVTD